eukprot:1676399-Rhodomonas_salina.6
MSICYASVRGTACICYAYLKAHGTTAYAYLLRPSSDHLGNVYGRIGRSDKAVTYYTMSLRVKKDIGDMTGSAIPYRCRRLINVQKSQRRTLSRAD